MYRVTVFRERERSEAFFADSYHETAHGVVLSGPHSENGDKLGTSMTVPWGGVQNVLYGGMEERFVQ